MSSTPLPPSFGQNIYADIELLWPGREMDIDVFMDDLRYYTDILECTGEMFVPIYCDVIGANSRKKAIERVHGWVKCQLRAKFSIGDQGAKG